MGAKTTARRIIPPPKRCLSLAFFLQISTLHPLLTYRGVVRLCDQATHAVDCSEGPALPQVMTVDNGMLDHGNKQPRLNAEEEDPDAILASFEEEDDSTYRAQRLQELKNTGPATTSNTVKQTYTTLKSDDEALSFTTEHERAVLHFFHPDFARCSTMDIHCEAIAEKHNEYDDGDVAFARINVNHAPFVVEKLSVRVLPCVIGFVKGVVKGRVTGFEGLCWDGKETSTEVTQALENTLVDWTVLRKRLLLRHEGVGSDDDEDAPDRRRDARRGIRDRKQTADDDDDEWD